MLSVVGVVGIVGVVSQPIALIVVVGGLKASSRSGVGQQRRRLDG